MLSAELYVCERWKNKKKKTRIFLLPNASSLPLASGCCEYVPALHRGDILYCKRKKSMKHCCFSGVMRGEGK